MGDYKVCNSGYTIKIDVSWRVLDVGSGDNPHPRSDVIMDKKMLKIMKNDLVQILL